MTIREALAHAGDCFKSANIETPGLDASILLAQVLNTDRSALIANGTQALSEENLAALRALINRRVNGECVAYIIGKKEFRGLEFLVNPSVLVPRPDTETLVEAALEILGGEKSAANEIRVLDLCTGSGAVAIALKNEMPAPEVHASDISAEALQTAKENARLLLQGKTIHFHLGDLYEALSPQTAGFSLIVGNPPYIPSDEIKTLSAEVQQEPRLALDGGASGSEIIARIIENAPKHLKRGGILLLEADPRQMETITILLEKTGFKDIKLYYDLSGNKRVIGGKHET